MKISTEDNIVKITADSICLIVSLRNTLIVINENIAMKNTINSWGWIKPNITQNKAVYILYESVFLSILNYTWHV